MEMAVVAAPPWVSENLEPAVVDDRVSATEEADVAGLPSASSRPTVTGPRLAPAEVAPLSGVVVKLIEAGAAYS
jgi:hypothetical protein